MMVPELATRKFKTKEFYYNKQSFNLLPFNFYRLDSGKVALINFIGELLFVSVEDLTRIVDKKVEPDSKLYKDLISNFFISEETIPELVDVIATRYRTKKSFLDDFTSLHIFVTTLRCNHSCHYCQVSRVTEDKLAFDMSIEDLNASIELMLKSPSKNITMEFQGGEPLLAFNKLKYAVERTEELNRSLDKKIQYVVCTNATIYNEEIAELFKKHKILVSTSLDGPREIHDKNRFFSKGSSYDSVVDGINYYRNTLGSDQVSALMTTSALSLNHPTEIINAYIENGFSNIFLREIHPFGFALRNPEKNKYETERFLDFYKKGLDYILKINFEGRFFMEDYATIILKKILTPFPVGFVDLQSPSGLVNSVILYNYDGYVYASDEARMLAENDDFTFRIGHVSEDYQSLLNKNIVQKISETMSNEFLAGCSDCALNPYCGADPIRNHKEFNDLYGYRPDSMYCRKNMGIISYILELLSLEDPKINKVFRNWINGSSS